VSPSSGLPDGQTNFDIEGNSFHFHSKTSAGNSYEALEVVCSDVPYGNWADGVVARYWGYGKVARTSGNPKNKDWEDGYLYYVATQDNGEGQSATNDTWRIRIFDKDQQGNPTDVLFDSNYNYDAIYDNDPVLCPGSSCNSGFTPDFDGLYLSGGNIQVHCKN